MQNTRRGRIANAITLGRLALLPALGLTIVYRPSIAWIWVATVILADVFDGVLARRLGADTITRRALDATVDRFTIHASFAVAVAVHPIFLPVYLPLLVRDAFALGASGYLMQQRPVLLLGGHLHKASSLSCALFGMTILAAPTSVAESVGWTAVAINFVLLLDYAGGFAITERHEYLGRFRIERLAGIRELYAIARRPRASAMRQPPSTAAEASGASLPVHVGAGLHREPAG